MEADRLARVTEALGRPRTPAGVEGVVAVCVELLSVSGAGIAVIGDGQHRGAVALSDAGLAEIDELQFSLGEGPCLDADRQGRPVLEPDLGSVLGQWPAWTPAAVAEGIHAVFAFPLRVGGARLGALTLYRDTPGDLADQDVGDAALLADLATGLLLNLEAETAPGSLPVSLSDITAQRAEVHQATGMIAAQLDISVSQALTRLRAYAWAEGRPIHDVAADVVARQLRFN
jgi:GAF domain-containing protein